MRGLIAERSSRQAVLGQPKMAIDKALRKPIEAGLIPGVVAIAADDCGVIYESASPQLTRANFCSERSSWSGLVPKRIGQ
jgi:hypothetical protein